MFPLIIFVFSHSFSAFVGTLIFAIILSLIIRAIMAAATSSTMWGWGAPPNGQWGQWGQQQQYYQPPQQYYRPAAPPYQPPTSSASTAPYEQGYQAQSANQVRQSENEPHYQSPDSMRYEDYEQPHAQYPEQMPPTVA
ncbi:MAG: hypothetical protein IMW89_12575 [Ktedonobacteraceae bacterium]|nr:hypothetical protein [Ktedonobacteraceae bacterium]